jgi:hypothetical protein
MVPVVEPIEIAIVGVTLLAFAAVSRRIDSSPFTMPMVFVATGAALSALGIVEVGAEMGAVGLLAEVTLAVILFSDAACGDSSRFPGDCSESDCHSRFLPGRW